MIQKSTRRSLLVLLTVLFLLLPSSLWAIGGKGAGRIAPQATLLESRPWQGVPPGVARGAHFVSLRLRCAPLRATPQRLIFARDPIPSEGLRPEAVARVEGSENLISRKKGPSYESDEGFYESLSPEEKDRIKNRSKKWESLPPEKRRELERRMNQWKALPPEEKDLMRKRHQQWQELPPGERDRIREKLNRWDSLTPQEQDEIRNKFKRP